jgi:hypothetical protein
MKVAPCRPRYDATLFCEQHIIDQAWGWSTCAIPSATTELNFARAKERPCLASGHAGGPYRSIGFPHVGARHQRNQRRRPSSSAVPLRRGNPLLYHCTEQNVL